MIENDHLQFQKPEWPETWKLLNFHIQRDWLLFRICFHSIKKHFLHQVSLAQTTFFPNRSSKKDTTYALGLITPARTLTHILFKLTFGSHDLDYTIAISKTKSSQQSHLDNRSPTINNNAISHRIQNTPNVHTSSQPHRHNKPNIKHQYFYQIVDKSYTFNPRM